MADVHDTATRSFNMSRIKGKNTKPEMLVRRFLHAHGYRYRLHDKRLPRKPDIALPKYRTIVNFILSTCLRKTVPNSILSLLYL
jgi:DNA mismatch endonuclease (patch repair protein)